jgi:hypothetical protein
MHAMLDCVSTITGLGMFYTMPGCFAGDSVIAAIAEADRLIKAVDACSRECEEAIAKLVITCIPPSTTTSSSAAATGDCTGAWFNKSPSEMSMKE